MTPRGGEIVVRSDGFTPLAEEALPVALAHAHALIGRAGTRVTRVPIEAPSLAEGFGRSVRELHAVLTTLVDAMRPSRTWMALRIHRTEHTGPGPDERAIDDARWGAVGVVGYTFDPAVFLLPWRDNTLERPWTPWGFLVCPFSDDEDDTHVFYEIPPGDGPLVTRPPTGRCTVSSHPDALDVIGLRVAWPPGVLGFRVTDPPQPP